MKRIIEKYDEENIWSDGSFAENLSSEDMKTKMRTFHMKHDEEMLFHCRKCDKPISAHNKDWHGGMCDKCFDKEIFPDEKQAAETQTTLDF